MTDEQKVQEFTQQVYLTKNNRRIKDITSTNGVEELAKTVIWCNLFLDELKNEQKSDNSPINWWWVRENDKEIGTIAAADDTFDLPSGVERLVIDENRPLVIKDGDSLVSEWDIVEPSQLTSRNHYSTPPNRVAYVNGKIVFSRALNSSEIGSKVYADVINDTPELASDDASLLDLGIPRQLLVLGTAKNSVLPDIVQGGLTPSYVQKYGDVLNLVKMRNDNSSTASEVVQEDLSEIGGIY